MAEGKIKKEEIRISGEELLGKVKELIKQGKGQYQEDYYQE